MQTHYHIIIAGAGGIAEAAGLLLAEWSSVAPTIFIGDCNFEKAKKVAQWIENGASKNCKVIPYYLNSEEITEEMKSIFNKGDALLDCLPGKLAPKMAQFSIDFNLYYANLTEYVAETNQILEIGKTSNTGFVLQTGLAPGYIDVLANYMFQQFCNQYNVAEVDCLEFKVGALTTNAVAPHYYGFTWSPIGVATEYVKECIALRNFKKVNLPALSERATLIIDGIAYEEDLTSGGAADLPDALSGKVKKLDYKTLRHPGHYDWVDKQLNKIKNSDAIITDLQEIMLSEIPLVEDDQIVLYVAVEGKDDKGNLRRQEISKHIKPQKVGKHLLRAIQTTTAAPLVQSIHWLLENKPKGITLQSQLDASTFLNGAFVKRVYGEV
ncbi:saccharopine dehydrogenase [Aureibaculum marinum]|uniref:Saccharopine dehydrogenase n=1 Tax=Aureibaculum marinum TaxID=2487930 RepID=A0A3N4NI82_9FLAO|nr:saccharopine dehydrogenase C-terminal domain-containing protein [Aureibaculum marinum]RPD91800.1 saccharopine dehydrogenase [Aureibaculum marinum]